MSRTDKDRPSWVRNNDPTEDRYLYHSHLRWEPGVGRVLADCVVEPDVPRYAAGRYTRSACGWEVRRRHWWAGGVPNWFTHHLYYEPERTRERCDLREAAKLANAGEMDDDFDFPNFQHRHNAAWNWW